MSNAGNSNRIDRTYCGGAVIQLATQNYRDRRGSLCPVEFPVHGFSPIRAFAINGAPGSVRGRHGHKTGQQLLMLVSGKVEIEFRQGDNSETVLMDEDNRLLLVRPMVWARQKYLTENASLMVFSDTPYDPDEYFHDDEEAVSND